MRAAFDVGWSALPPQLNQSMRQWRVEQPKATLSQIELALDTQMAVVRAKMLQSLATASAATNPKLERATEQPVCPKCGGGLHSGGQPRRRLITQQDQSLELERTYSYCPKCETGFFPLAEELGLLANTALTPQLQAGLLRLGTALPFRQTQTH